jgi:primosomal protein N' (replication factor Y)
MYTITVTPVARGTSIDELSYFSAIEYPVGSFIQVPIRGKEKRALVIFSQKVTNVKSALRSNTFVLQKIKRQKYLQLMTPEFVRAVEKTARYHATTTGAVLYASVPKALLKQPPISQERFQSPKPRLRGFIIPRLYQGLSQSRIEFYRTSIREAFAAAGSVFVTVPSTADAERVFGELSGGIEQYSFMIHNAQSKTMQGEYVASILACEHPVFIVAPPSFLSLPRHDLTTIIVERESSPLYRSRTRPFLDFRVLAHELAAQLGGQLFLADLPLRVDSIHRRETGEYEEIVTGHHRMHFPTRAEIINMQGLTTSTKDPFRVIHKELLSRIEEIGDHGGRTFLYVARRGLSPVTLCRDCGTVVTCKECGVSVVLHKGSEENYFLCHSCGALRHARERCTHCQSWRLEAFGIGTELVERELREILPERFVSVLSSDTTKTHTQTHKIMEAFYDTPKAILIGTEMALPYLTKHVPLVGVVSLDSLLSLASWNIYERIASTLTRLREIAGEQLIVQTRKPEASILRTAISGNFSGFYRSELKIRKALGYPPYTVIIKVSVTGSQESITKQMEDAVQHLAPYELVTFSRFLKAPGGKFILHGFLRIAREKWPDEVLLKRLQSLPPIYTVTVDPDSIL